MKAGRHIIGTVIDEDGYNSIMKMFSSNDPADWEVARRILYGCNERKSIYWIWKIMCKYAWTNRLCVMRTLAAREFRDSIAQFEICRMREEEFAGWLLDRRWMTPEIFGMLKNSILEYIVQRAENKFFDIYVDLKENKRALILNYKLKKISK